MLSTVRPREREKNFSVQKMFTTIPKESGQLNPSQTAYIGDAAGGLGNGLNGN